MDITLLGLIIMLAVYSSPLILFILFFIYLTCSPSIRFCRLAVVWLIVPQLVLILAGILCLLWLDLDYLAHKLGLIFSSSFCVLLCAIPVANRYMHNSQAIIITSHILCLTLTLAITNALENNHLPSRISNAWEKQTLLRMLARADHGNTRELATVKDDATREKLLALAAKDLATPVNVLQYLTDQVNSPFENKAQNLSFYTELNIPFFIAFEANNINAVRIFSEQLTGSSPRAQYNRGIVSRKNPLVTKTYYFFRDDAKKTALFELANIILPIMPELLNDDVHKNIIDERDSQLIAFFWWKNPPRDRQLILKELTILVSQQTTMSDEQVARVLENDQSIKKLLTDGMSCEKLHHLLETESKNPSDEFEALMKRVLQACP